VGVSRPSFPRPQPRRPTRLPCRGDLRAGGGAAAPAGRQASRRLGRGRAVRPGPGTAPARGRPARPGDGGAALPPGVRRGADPRRTARRVPLPGGPGQGVRAGRGRDPGGAGPHGLHGPALPGGGWAVRAGGLPGRAGLSGHRARAVPLRRRRPPAGAPLGLDHGGRGVGRPRRPRRGHPAGKRAGADRPGGALWTGELEVQLAGLRPDPQGRRRALPEHVPGRDGDGPGPVRPRRRRLRPVRPADRQRLLRRDLRRRVPLGWRAGTRFSRRAAPPAGGRPPAASPPARPRCAPPA
jgi:hypothetical protein